MLHRDALTSAGILLRDRESVVLLHERHERLEERVGDSKVISKAPRWPARGVHPLVLQLLQLYCPTTSTVVSARIHTPFLLETLSALLIIRLLIVEELVQDEISRSYAALRSFESAYGDRKGG